MNVFKLCSVPLVMFAFFAAGILLGNPQAVGQEKEYQKAKEMQAELEVEYDHAELAKAASKQYYQIVTEHQKNPGSPNYLRVVGAFEENEEEEIDQSLISDYWIGVQCEKAGSTTYSPKELPDAELKIDGGMKILAVTEGGAADESGLEEDDVLLKFATKEMNSVNDLYAVIGETKDEEADLLLIRGGELVSLRITPQKRPEPEVSEEVPTAGLWEIKDAINYELNGKQLPKDYRVKIELSFGEDVVVTASKGKESWSADAESIDKLPSDLKPVARDLIAKCQPIVNENVDLVWHGGGQQFLPHGQFLRSPLMLHNPDNRLIEIYERLKELTTAVKQLKEKMDD